MSDEIDFQIQIRDMQIAAMKIAVQITRRENAACIADQIAQYGENPAALAYYAKCRADDQRVTAIQKMVCDQLAEHYSDVVPAGSFTSRTNLLGSSDVDIYVFQELKEQPPAELAILSGQPVQHVAYESYTKKINGVDVEIKFRPDREIMQLHEWLDTQMTHAQRVAVTYIKHRASDDPQHYALVKRSVFNWALIQMGQEPRF
jgi:hypothetical protein